MPSQIYDDVVEGGFNIKAGLRNWYLGRSNAGVKSDGTGLGGIDVLMVGDSIFEGGIASTYLYDTFPHRLKLLLQGALNPPGVIGGYGYMPATQGTSSTNWAACSANYNSTGFGLTGITSPGYYWSIGAGGNGARYMSGTNASGADRRYLLVVDGTDANATYKRLQCDRIQVVGAQGPVVGNWQWDVSDSETTFFTTGTGDYSGTVAGSGSLQWGHHWHFLDAQVLDKTAKWAVQITSPASLAAYLEGFVLYNGDYDRGVRVHNLARWGTTTANFSGDATALAALDVWGKNGANDGTGAATTGACRAKLVMFDFITNDCATSVALGTFTTNYGILIDRALALASKPSVLIVIPPMYSGGTEATYQTYISAIYDIAANKGVAVLNLHRAYGLGAPNTATTGLVALMGHRGDGIHYNDNGAETFAKLVSSLLLSGDTGHAAAPVSAQYILQKANAELGSSQSLGALTTGLVKNTVTGTTGVLSIASAGVDYATPAGTETLTNKTVQLKAVPGSDNTFTGVTVQFTANEAQAFGDVVHIVSSGKAALAKADAVANALAFGMCVDSAGVEADATGNYLLLGVVRHDAWNWADVGPVYLSTTGTTTNTLTQTAPSGANNVVQILGIATHADRMMFNPQLVQVEHV